MSRCYNKIKGLRAYTWQSFDSVHAHLLLPTKPLFIWSDWRAHLSQHMNFKFWNSPNWLKKLICVTVLQCQQFTAGSVCFPPAEKAQRSVSQASAACRHGCEDHLVCGGLIQNGNEWAKILWVRGKEEHILLVPGFFQVIISHIVLTIKLLISIYQVTDIPGNFDFQGLLHKIIFFTCESKLRNIE